MKKTYMTIMSRHSAPIQLSYEFSTLQFFEATPRAFTLALTQDLFHGEDGIALRVTRLRARDSELTEIFEADVNERAQGGQ